MNQLVPVLMYNGRQIVSLYRNSISMCHSYTTTTAVSVVLVLTGVAILKDKWALSLPSSRHISWVSVSGYSAHADLSGAAKTFIVVCISGRFFDHCRAKGDIDLESNSRNR